MRREDNKVGGGKSKRLRLDGSRFKCICFIEVPISSGISHQIL